MTRRVPGRRSIMKAKHVMTKDPSCCLPSEPAARAARIMRDENTGAVPVIDNEQSQKIVGVVTDRDLCMNVVAESRHPDGVPVEACMTTSVVTCSPSDAGEKVRELRKENQVRRIPVVDDQHRLQGIVSMADLVSRAELKPAQAHDTLKRVSAPAGEPSKPRAKSAAERAA